MVLVLGVATRLPGLRVDGLGDLVLGGGGGRVAREVPAGEGEGARHYCEEDLRETSLLIDM